MEINKIFELKELKRENIEHIVIDMQGDWNDADYVNESEILYINDHTLELLYFLSLFDDVIKDYSGDIFTFLRQDYLENLPSGYEQEIHTLTYDLTYYDSNNIPYSMKIIPENIPDEIKNYINNLVKVYEIFGYCIPNKFLLDIILKQYNKEFIEDNLIYNFIKYHKENYYYCCGYDLNELFNIVDKINEDNLESYIKKLRVKFKYLFSA